MTVVAFRPYWDDISMDNLQKHRNVELFESEKESILGTHKFPLYYLSEKHQEREFGNDLTVRHPYPLYPHFPSCLHLGKQLWVMNAVTNKTTLIADVALGVIFPRENSWGPDRINQLSLFRCLTFMWGLYSSIIHANAARSKQIAFTPYSDLITKQSLKWVLWWKNILRWLQLDERDWGCIKVKWT